VTPIDIGTSAGNVAGGYISYPTNAFPNNPFAVTNNGMDIFANGYDIWNAADGFEFTAKQVTGNFDRKVRVQKLLGADQWSKAGLLARPSTNAGSRFINMVDTPATFSTSQAANNFASFQWRDTDGSGTLIGNINGPSPVYYPNGWVRLQRLGSLFNGYWSSNNVDWNLVASRDTAANGGAYPDTIWVGFCTVSHDQTRALANNAYAEYRDLYSPDLPTITVQPNPTPQYVAVGSPASISVTATNPGNSGALSYQWLKNGVQIPGATSSTLSFPTTALSDTASYTAYADNDGGARVSAAAALTVLTPPTITQQPTNVTVQCTSSADFYVTATGDAPLSYQWYVGASPIGGATTSNLHLAVVTLADNGKMYSVVVTNLVGTNTSASATLTVVDTVPPVVTCPSDIVAQCAGGGAVVTFSASVTDTCDSSPTTNCVPASGSTFPLGPTSVTCTGQDHSGNSASCMFNVTVVDTIPPVINCSTNITLCGTNGTAVSYTVTASDACDAHPTLSCVPASGSAFNLGTTTVNCTAYDASLNTNMCSFTVTVNGVTTATALASLTNCPGTSASFSTTGSGAGSLTYSWTSNGVAVAGATTSSFTVSPVTASAGGTYCVIVTGGCNSVTNCATLTVVAPPSISSQPGACITSVGNGTRFSVVATDANTTVYPLTYQWQTNGVDIADGPNVTGSTTASITFSNVTLAANGLQFRVKVTDCAGTTTSSSVLLTVVAGNDFVTKASQGAGNNWTAAIWSNPPNTAVSSPVAGNTYELIANGTAWGVSTGNTRTRNPATDGLQTFPGDSLTVNTNTDIRFKRGVATTPISATISYFPGVGGNPGLILNGGILNAGDPSEFVVTGNVFVASQSILTGGNNGGGEQQDPRSIFLRGKLSGPGNLVILQSSQPTPMQVDADGSGYSGNWIIQDGFLQGLGSNSLGSGSFLVTPTNLLAAASGSNFSKLEISYDLSSTATLVLSNNPVSGSVALMVLHQNLRFGAAIINGTSLARGVYTYAQLAAAYPSNFAPGGSGSITIGPFVKLVNEAKSGNNFTASFQTQSGISYIVEYTDSLTPPAWHILTTIPGDGTVKTFTDTTATTPDRLYRVRVP
jgi:hypothetical protein